MRPLFNKTGLWDMDEKRPEAYGQLAKESYTLYT